MELYPRIGENFDIKVFKNYRFGMMSWDVLAVTYCIKQYETYGTVSDSMLVNTALMLVYVTKFFWWEAGYWNTMDIAHDRAGFYICLGCLVWVPSVYTSPGMYLFNHQMYSQLPQSLLSLSALKSINHGSRWRWWKIIASSDSSHLRKFNFKVAGNTTTPPAINPLTTSSSN